MRGGAVRLYPMVGGCRATRVRRVGFLRWEVLRTKPDGSLDWATTHLTKRGAGRAAVAYERYGGVKGRRP